MPNIMITHLQADDWAALRPPCPCSSFFVQNADTALGFQFRANNDEIDTEITIAPGYALPIGPASNMNSEDIVGYVKGGELIISVGLGVPMPVL